MPSGLRGGAGDLPRPPCGGTAHPQHLHQVGHRLSPAASRGSAAGVPVPDQPLPQPPLPGPACPPSAPSEPSEPGSTDPPSLLSRLTAAHQPLRSVTDLPNLPTLPHADWGLSDGSGPVPLTSLLPDLFCFSRSRSPGTAWGPKELGEVYQKEPSRLLAALPVPRAHSCRAGAHLDSPLPRSSPQWYPRAGSFSRPPPPPPEQCLAFTAARERAHKGTDLSLWKGQCGFYLPRCPGHRLGPGRVAHPVLWEGRP